MFHKRLLNSWKRQPVQNGLEMIEFIGWEVCNLSETVNDQRLRRIQNVNLDHLLILNSTGFPPTYFFKIWLRSQGIFYFLWSVSIIQVQKFHFVTVSNSFGSLIWWNGVQTYSHLQRGFWSHKALCTSPVKKQI